MGVSLARQDRADGKILVRWWEWWWWWWWKGERQSSRRLGPGDLMRTMHAGLNRPDCASVVATNVVARTALLNHSCSQHHRPRQRKRKKKKSLLPSSRVTCSQSLGTSENQTDSFFFFLQFCVFTFKVRFWKKSARLHNTAKCSQLDESPVQVSFFFLVGCLLVGGGPKV